MADPLLITLRANGSLSVPRLLAALVLVGVIFRHSDVDAVVLMAIVAAVYAAAAPRVAPPPGRAGLSR